MFKKKFRSLAIVALSFLMVVSFGVGISTFDTKYTPKAQAATVDMSSWTHSGSGTRTVGADFIQFASGGSQSGTFVSNSTYTNVSNISFKLSTSDKSKTYLTIKIGSTEVYKINPIGDVVSGNNTDTSVSVTINNPNTTAANISFVLGATTSSRTVKVSNLEITTGGGGDVDQPTVYTVSYVDGVDSETITVPTDNNSYESGDTVTISSTIPTRNGYTFAGWSDGTTVYQAGNTFTMPSSNVTLTAQWNQETTYAVTYNANADGVTGMPSGGNVTALSTSVPKRDGFAFIGWNTSNDGNGTYYAPGANITSSLELYAIWGTEVTSWTKPAWNTFWSTQFAGNTSTSPVALGQDEVIKEQNGIVITALANNSYANPQHHNQGNGESSGSYILLNVANVNGLSITLPAGTWTVNIGVSAYNTGSRSLKFNGVTRGGENTNYDGIKTGESDYASQGCYDCEWNTIPGGTYNLSATTERTYIHYIRISGLVPDDGEFIVTFNGNGGTPSTSSMRTTDGVIATLPTATRDGYSFNGWYTQAEGGTKVNDGASFDANTELFAQWTQVEKTINSVVSPSGSYTMVAGSALSTAQLPSSVTGNWTGSDGSDGTVSVPVTNWTVTEGSISEAGTVTVTGTLGAVSGYSMAGGIVSPTATITVTAQPQGPTVTVTFNLNGGTLNGQTSYSMQVAEGGLVPRPDDPVKTGSLWFGGWYTDNTKSSHGNKFDFAYDTVSSNKTLYALWIDPVDTESFQAYIDYLIDETAKDIDGEPIWATEGFKKQWNYIDGVFLNSIVNLYYNTNNTKYSKFFLDFVTNYVGSDGSLLDVTTGKALSSYPKELDFICESKILFDAYTLSGEEKYLKAIDKIYDHLMGLGRVDSTQGTKTNGGYSGYLGNFEHKSSYDQEIWLDGMYMYAPFYARYWSSVNSNETATKLHDLRLQYQFIFDNMRDETGLVHHAYSGTSKIWNDGAGTCSHNFWLRSMGWLVTSLADCIEYFPEGDDKNYLISEFQETMDALLKYRDPDTLTYYQIINYGSYIDDNGTARRNYLETSGSAMIAYSLMKGGRLGYLTGELNYHEEGRKTFEGLYNHSLDSKTNDLYDICKSAGVGGSNNRDGSIEYYLSEPVSANEGKGVGPFIMAFIEYSNATPVTPTTPDINKRRVNVYSGNDFVETIEIVKGAALSTISAPEKAGYTFEGWYSDAAFTNKLADSTTISEDITLYARYIDSNATYYTVTFMSNGSVYITTQVEENTVVGEPNEPEKSGYTFAGWYSDSGLTEKFNFSTQITANTTLYAKWTRSTTAVATYTFDKGTNAEDWNITSSNSNYTSSFTNATYNGISVKDGYMIGFALTNTSNQYVYARTTESYNSVTKISFDVTSTDKGKTTIAIAYTTDGGENYTTIMNATTTETMGVSSNKEWANYTYNLETPVSGQLVFIVSATSSGKYAALDNITVTYGTSEEETDEYSVTYDDGVGGEEISMPSNSNTFAAGDTFTISGATPSRTGYAFTGWSSTAFDGLKQPNSSFTMPASDVTLTANWVKTYTVTFVVDEETVKTQTVNENGYATAPDQPEKSGYVFRGWSADGNAISDVATYKITEDTTFTALWEEESSTKYTVTFDLNGGNIGGETSYSIQVSDGAYATKPTNPTKTGSTFMGWYTTEDKSKNKDEFDFDEEAITDNLTLYALWFESVDESAFVSYIQGLMDGTDLTTMDQGKWNTETWRGYFNYVNGIFLNSLVNLSYNTSDATQKEEYEQFVVDYLERYIREDGTIVQYSSKTAAPDPENASVFNDIIRIDFIQTVRTLFDAYEFSRDERFLKAVEYALDKFADAAKVQGTYNNPPHTPSDLNEIWLDGLYMYAPLYARYIAAGGKNSSYSALELFNQYTVVVDNMRDSTTGLYYHGYAVDKDTSASPWADPDTGLSASFWSRSVGWLAMSLVDVLDYYPEGVSISKSFKGTNYTDARAYLTAVFKDLMDSLLVYQDADSKMFYQILNHDSIISGVSNDNYLETSGSAMFAYALMKGGKAGYLTGNYTTTYGETLSYNNIGRQIFEGVYAHSVSVSGSTVNVYDICGATSLSGSDSDSMSTYIGNKIVSNESKGTAPIILAFIEYFNETVKQPETPNVNERKIYLVTNGGEHNLGVDYIVANINGTLASSALPTVTKTDYEFTGWYLDSALTQAFTADSTVLTDETTTLYAGWALADDAESVEITLDANDGTFSDSQTSITAIVSQSNPELLSSHIPTRDGYDFGGFADSNGTLYFDADGILCDGVELSGGETLYAVWKQTFTIKLDFSSFIDAASQATNNNGYNTVFTFRDGTTTKVTDTSGHYYYDFSANTVDGFYAPTGERLNYVLIAWADQDGNEYAPDSLIIPTKDLTLTPIFYVDPDSIGSRVSVSGETVTWSAYEMSNGKYPESDTNKLYQNIRWTDLYADYKDGTVYTIINNDLVTVTADTSQMETNGTDNGHRATTEPMIRFQKSAGSKTPMTITINKSGVTAKVTVYGFLYNSSNTATLTLYDDGTAGGSVSLKAGYGGANTITDTVLSGKTPASGTFTDTLSYGNTYTIRNGSSNNFFMTTIAVELSDEPTFTVSFEEDGGTSVSDVSNIAVGGKVSAPTAPTKSGFAFDGWYSDSNLTKAYDFNTVVTNDTTLFAKWVESSEPVQEYTISFNSNGGGSFDNQTTVNGKLTSLPQPTKEGYTFDGWYQSDDFSGDKVTTGTVFDGNTTLYAKWTVNKYTLTYVYGNGTANKQSSVEYNSTVTLESEPSRTGYTFGGWSVTSGGVEIVDNTFTMGTANVTLTAVWNPIEYTIAFDKNNEDATGEMSPIVATYGQATGLTQNGFTLSGYTFLGWATSENGDVVYQDGESVENLTEEDGATVTLYAIWEAEGAGNTVTVNYNFTELKDENSDYNDNNGGNVTINGEAVFSDGPNSGHIYTAEATNGVLLSSSSVQRINYNLVGWATTQYGEKVYDAGGTYNGNDDTITLYPVWEVNNTANRTTTTVNGDIETYYWSSYVVNSSYDPNNAESFYYMGADNEEYKNIRWTDLYKDSVSNGIYTISENEKYSIKADSNKVGNVNYSGASVDAGHRMMSEPFIRINKTTENAIYSPIEIVIANGYTASIKVYAVVYNRASQVSILASDKSTVMGSASVSNKYNSSTVRQEQNDFSVGFTPNVLEVSSLRTGTYYIANTGAYQSGNSDTCNNIFITGIEISLTPAVPEQNVNFYTNASESDQTIFETVQTFGGTLVFPNTDPVREGFKFDGWYTERINGTKVEEGIEISEETNYYAHWTELPKYSVNFEESYPQGVNTGIKNMPEDIVDTTETSITPSSPSLAGYSFLGWATISGATSATYAPGASIDITGNPILYPVWAEATEENFIIYKDGVRGTIPNDFGITYELVGGSEKTGDSVSIDGAEAITATTYKSGGASPSASSRYISITVPSSVASSFKIKVIAASNSENGAYSIWVGKEVIRSIENASFGVSLVSGNGYATYKTGISEPLSTSDENGDITYYINFDGSSRFYEISLELTKEVDTNVERTISFVTDDNDLRPFEDDIPDAKVTNGESFSLAAFVPTTSSQGYEFSHWEDSFGNEYGNSIESVLRDMTLYAKWFTIASSADTPESTRGKVPRADAQVYGLYLPSTTTVRLANGSTVSWSVDWDYSNATYATELDGDYTAKNISNYQNINEVGFYKVKGYITVPNGYRFYDDGNQSDEIVVESIVEVYVIGAQVMAGAGYMSDGRTAWNSGLALTNDRYTLSENGEVSIVVDADNIGEITNDGIINLTGAIFSNSTYKADAPIEINLPSEYSMLLIVIKVTNATSNNVSLYTEDGRSVPLSQTVGATYTNLSISTTDNYGNILYLFSSGNNTELHSIVVNAQYEDTIINEENLGEYTNKLYYHTVINDNNSYGEAIEEPYNYLDQAKVIVKPQTEHLDLPDHYLFSRWATATSGTASYYNPGDVLTITSETNNLYVIMDEEPKITITFDVNAPAGMTNDQISQIFGSFTLEYKIYSGDKLDSIPNFSEVKFTVNGYEYTFDGWSPNITQDTTFNEDTTITASWYTDTLPVIVKDLEKTVQEGTTENEIINSLPTEFVVCDINGNETSDFDNAVIVGSWTKVTYNANVAGAYIFRATLDTAPSGTVWYSSWTGVEIDSQTYVRSQDGTYYVYCKVIVVEADAYATYSAEFTAFAYTGTGDHVFYNNNSNTHDKSWSDYYKVATDDNSVPGTIVARNGGVKIIADNETVVDEDDGITAALVDTDYHGQTWSMIKGYHQTSANAPFIYVVVPKGYASVKIHVYAVRFRASGNDVTLHVGPLNGTKENMLVTDHSYTETDNETDFNYFYGFSPSYYLYEYSGDGNDTVFTVRNTSNNTNIYLTGIKVEYTMVETESHIITYHANDGTDNALTREVVYAENENGDDAMIEKNFFERDGYEFIGWSRTKGSDSIEENYQVGKSLELNGNITLYAVWQRARALTYYANDGSTDSFIKYYVNGRGPLSENEFDMTAETREDKVFLSWNTQSNGQGVTYYPGDIFNPNASKEDEIGIIPEGTVLYAQWGSGKTLTAKWDAYSSELQAIDTVYTDCSQTFGVDWTTRYANSIIAKNGDVLTVNASGATAGSKNMSKPMLSLAKNSSISVGYNLPDGSGTNALTIRVSAVVESSSSKIKIGDKEFAISRKFTDGGAFTPFVADIAVYATSVNGNGSINITTTGNSAVYIVGISASISSESFEGNTLIYSNGLTGAAEETYDYLVSGSTIVDINHFHRDGYTFAGWATTEGGEVAYTYGQELTVSQDTTLYAKWTPITYDYKFISEGVNYETGEFEFGNYINAPETNPTKQGYIFMGWYLDDGVFQNQADFEKGFAPSFEMIDGDTVYLYAYFVQDLHNKTIVTPNELQDLEKYIVDIMSNVYREEGSTSGTARVSANALELPANVMVTGDGFGKNLAIDWSLAVNGWTLSSLQSGTQTLTGYIILDKDDYNSFAFSDGVNDNLQQIGITVDLTLRNIIIQFNNNEPLAQKNFYYPVGTKRTAVVSQFEVKGFYLDRNGLRQEWIPTGLVWVCPNYDSEKLNGQFVFSTNLYADIGYAFEVKNDEDKIVESKTIVATANVTLQGNAEAYSGVGFERKGSSDWTNGVTGDFVIDSNGEVGNRLVLTGLSNSYGNENGYLTLDAGENALKISIPSGTEEITISYIGGVRTVGNSNTFSIVDANGNVLSTTNNLSAYQSATLDKLTITSDNVNNLSSLTELYVKINGDEILLSQILVTSTPVITMSENVVKLRFMYNGVEKYYAIANGDGTIGTATKYVKGSKVILPDFAGSGLIGAPTAENIEFAGWSNDGSSQVASYMAGGLYDLDTYTDVEVGNVTERVVTLYAVFSIGYHTLTFDSGFGKTVEFKIQIGKTVGEVITIRGTGREQALKDLEESRVGYNFVDWTYNDEIFSSYTLLDSDVVVTATWTPKTYTINYKNGNDVITTDMVTYTEIFEAPVLNKNPEYIDTTRTFRTWMYNGTDWDFGQASLESAGIILSNDIYEIDLQADFGAMITFITEYKEVVGSAYPIVQDSNVYKIGYRYSLKDRVTGLNGYEFMGWSKTQNSPTAEFTTESVIELKENITLYAVWKANEYRITFASGNANIDFTNLTVNGKALDENNSALFEFNTEIPTISATATGYVIHSWYYIDEQGFERTWVFGGSNPNKVMAQDITFYAKWGITVNFEKFSQMAGDTSFNEDGATLYNSVVVAIDGVIPFVHTQGTASSGTLHVRPQLPNYTFAGWYKDNQGTSEFDINQAFTIDFINSLKGDDKTVTEVTIYAGFNKVTGKVTISFADTFDTGASMPSSIEHANSDYFTITSEYILPNTDVAEFIGWSRNPDGSGDVYGLNDEIFIEGDTILYAFWTITIKDVVIEELIVRNDETIQVQIPYAYDGKNGDKVFEGVFEVKWKLAKATNADDLSDKELYDLTMGAHNIKAGRYSVPVELLLENGYVWAGSNLELLENGNYSTNVIITVLDSDIPYFIIKINSIEESTQLNSDYRLNKVTAEISTDSSATSGIEIMLDVTWSSQIDTTVWGTHYVLGSVHIGSYELKVGISQTVSATIEVTKSGEENAYLYKTYQDGTMPNAPDAPSGFEFLCWTDKGVTAVGQNGSAKAGEWTAMYTKLWFTEGGSIRLNKDYTGIRFTAHLEFYGTNYVAELMRNKSNLGGAVSVTMNFTYEKGGTTYNVGTGKDFMNMTQSKNGNNAVITFSGVISDLIVYNSDGTVNNNDNCGIEFKPTAKVKLNGAEVDSLTAGFSVSASHVASQVIGNYTDGTYQHDVLSDYIVS